MLIFCCPLIQGQSQPNFAEVDAIAANFDESTSNVEELATQLTAGLESDVEKARVFFMWLAHNVRYDCKKFHNPKRPHFEGRTKEAVAEQKKKWRAEQIQKTVKLKKGVCEDYSQLFKAMCDVVGLEAVVIRGNARNFYRPFSGKHSVRHAWNAVKLDGEWQLLEATWGAGTTNPEVTKFTRRISTGYFLTPPELFMQSHWPDEEQWQLLPKPLSKQEFAQQPLFNFGQTKYAIKDYAIDKENRTIEIEFVTKPSRLMLTNSKGKTVKFTNREEGDTFILTVAGSSTAPLNVFAGGAGKGKMMGLGKIKF